MTLVETQHRLALEQLRCAGERPVLLAALRALASTPRLPSPFTADDRERGYRYRLSVRLLELSDTRVFERPAQVRAWFELMLKDQLALGCPDQVRIVFGRKNTAATPGLFRTRIVTRGVNPQIHAYYKHFQGQAVLQARARAQDRDGNQRPRRLRCRPDVERHQLAGADPHRT